MKNYTCQTIVIGSTLHHTIYRMLSNNWKLHLFYLKSVFIKSLILYLNDICKLLIINDKQHHRQRCLFRMQKAMFYTVKWHISETQKAHIKKSYLYQQPYKNVGMKIKTAQHTLRCNCAAH